MKRLHRFLMFLSVFFFAASLVAIQRADHEQVGVPDYYRTLDTSLPFNELASKSLSLDISNAEYDAIRWQYFQDRVAPRFGPLQTEAAWEDFKQRTERPDSPKREKTIQDYVGLFRLTVVFSATYLALGVVLWLWTRIIRPARDVVAENGIHGLGRLILFGKKGAQAK